jgi:hypothetical protein
MKFLKLKSSPDSNPVFGETHCVDTSVIIRPSEFPDYYPDDYTIEVIDEQECGIKNLADYELVKGNITVCRSEQRLD